MSLSATRLTTVISRSSFKFQGKKRKFLALIFERTAPALFAINLDQGRKIIRDNKNGWLPKEASRENLRQKLLGDAYLAGVV